MTSPLCFVYGCPAVPPIWKLSRPLAFCGTCVSDPIMSGQNSNRSPDPSIRYFFKTLRCLVPTSPSFLCNFLESQPFSSGSRLSMVLKLLKLPSSTQHDSSNSKGKVHSRSSFFPSAAASSVDPRGSPHYIRPPDMADAVLGWGSVVETLPTRRIWSLPRHSCVFSRPAPMS